MDAPAKNLPLLTKEKLVQFYRPLWNELPKSEWSNITNLPWSKGSDAGAVVHVIAWEREELLALVANKKDQRRPDKKLGVGVPTEELLEGELPVAAAIRAMNEELNLFSGFQINPEPLTIRRDGRNVIHITFRAELEEFTELSKILIDPDGEIEGGFIIDPFLTIRIKKDFDGRRTVYTPVLGEREVYFSHLGLIALSLQ